MVSLKDGSIWVSISLVAEYVMTCNIVIKTTKLAKRMKNATYEPYIFDS